MNTIILIAVLGQSWNWSDSAADPKPDVPIVRPEPPKEWTPIYRNDSRGVSCRGYTERDLDAFIRGRESVYAQQEESQRQQKEQQSLVQAPRYRAVSICDQQYGCRTVMMPY